MIKKTIYRRIVTLILILISMILFLLIMYNENPIKNGKETLYISGSSIDEISKSLGDHGYEVNIFDRFLLNFVNLPKEGWYRLDKPEMGRYFFFKNLHKKESKTISIKIFAGETTNEMLYRISRDMMLNKTKLEEIYREYARFREGNILSGRYTLSRSSNEETVMRYLLDNSNTQLDIFAKEQFCNDLNATQLREALIIASIIQKESNDKTEMSSISSVIHNRLKKNMRLQMDGTLNYGEYARTIVTPERIKNDKSRFNTYKHKGLPPTPLSVVSIEALKAATTPMQSEYLFFMLNKNGKHDFAESYKEHLKNVKVFKAYCRERDEKKSLEKEKREIKVRESNKSLLILDED
ncbi:MAG: endolytic transglycosylase MltG [Campylobacterota bacterium]|nr:endolytic transglycosylase MltG [Campylobacterota bacterium]